MYAFISSYLFLFFLIKDNGGFIFWPDTFESFCKCRMNKKNDARALYKNVKKKISISLKDKKKVKITREAFLHWYYKNIKFHFCNFIEVLSITQQILWARRSSICLKFIRIVQLNFFFRFKCRTQNFNTPCCRLKIFKNINIVFKQKRSQKSKKKRFVM